MKHNRHTYVRINVGAKNFKQRTSTTSTNILSIHKHFKLSTVTTLKADERRLQDTKTQENR